MTAFPSERNTAQLMAEQAAAIKALTAEIDALKNSAQGAAKATDKSTKATKRGAAGRIAGAAGAALGGVALGAALGGLQAVGKRGVSFEQGAGEVFEKAGAAVFGVGARELDIRSGVGRRLSPILGAAGAAGASQAQLGELTQALAPEFLRQEKGRTDALIGVENFVNSPAFANPIAINSRTEAVLGGIGVVIGKFFDVESK